MTRSLPARARGRALIELMRASLRRAKAGVSHDELLKDARSYVPLIVEN